ncbi:rhodanese-like domain-containing protein [Marimonas lutisalis]|uniref:rhodanese-like domain-containing protein n=1 Tax=Marimonas lutisalis TaxID=2545756 RepID=UPI0010F4E932|nr:rhodanese-like domain-containing protein [Marimonas lutisalis]
MGRFLTGVFAAIAFSATVMSGPVLALDVPEKKRTDIGLYLTASEAAQMRASRSGTLLIDVRTRAEVAFVGQAAGVDRNIPYMVVDEFWEFDAKKSTYKLSVNPDFAARVAELVAARGLGKDATLILMCRSGSRSAKAANLLAKLGYAQVYSVVDGFEGDKGPSGLRDVNGWKNSGLAWSYKLPPETVY